ncbi:MAG: endonuclease domain-containing protein [Candidatus Parcubacteria bacterium]|nr:endonuclease domain-containing protein [Candidatus Parcubacteria bacterium]
MFNLKLHKSKRRLLRNKMTPAEVALWRELRREKLGYKFRRQYGVGSYIIDFYCPQLKFAIELDGDVHALEHVHKKDLIREKFIKDYGITIKRYWNHQVLEDIDSVLEELVYICKQLNDSNVQQLRSGSDSFSKLEKLRR